MRAMLKATFRCMNQLWVHPNAKSEINQPAQVIKLGTALIALISCPEIDCRKLPFLGLLLHGPSE